MSYLEILSKKHKLIARYLVALSTYKSYEDEEIRTLFSQAAFMEQLNLKTFNLIMYYLFGVIDKNLRNSLLPWPVHNIKTQKDFRKGTITILTEIQEKNSEFPFAKLQESQLSNPRAENHKVLDIILSLAQFCMLKIMNNSMLLRPPLIDHSMTKEEKEELLETIVDITTKQENKNVSQIVAITKYKETIDNLEKSCFELKNTNYQLSREIECMKINTMNVLNEEALDISELSLDKLEECYQNQLNIMSHNLSELEKGWNSSKEAVDLLNNLHKPKVFNFNEVCDEDGGTFTNMEHYCQFVNNKLDVLFNDLKLNQDTIEHVSELQELVCKLNETLHCLQTAVKSNLSQLRPDLV